MLEARLNAEAIDVTIPGTEMKLGHRHPMNITVDELKDIFIGMGFEIFEGNEVELSVYNFDRLNTDAGHPAREWTDTFYLDEDSRTLLRTHTSPMEPRIMESHKLPIRASVFGRCYRKDEVDATHSPMFHQMEGLVVDEHITFADLKGSLHNMAVQMYGPDTVTRFRRHDPDGTGKRGLLHELTGDDYRIVPNHTYTIQLIACESRVLYLRDGEVLFDVDDPEPYTSGWFGLRTLTNHMTVSDFTVHELGISEFQSCTPWRSTPAANMSELRARPIAVRYPPYDPPHSPMRFRSTSARPRMYFPAATTS
jgi:hypothetical protein